MALNTKMIPEVEGGERGINKSKLNKVKAKIKASLNGYSYKEASRILLDLLEELKSNSVITVSKQYY